MRKRMGTYLIGVCVLALLGSAPAFAQPNWPWAKGRQASQETAAETTVETTAETVTEAATEAAAETAGAETVAEIAAEAAGAETVAEAATETAGAKIVAETAAEATAEEPSLQQEGIKEILPFPAEKNDAEEEAARTEESKTEASPFLGEKTSGEQETPKEETLDMEKKQIDRSDGTKDPADKQEAAGWQVLVKSWKFWVCAGGASALLAAGAAFLCMNKRRRADESSMRRYGEEYEAQTERSTGMTERSGAFVASQPTQSYSDYTPTAAPVKEEAPARGAAWPAYQEIAQNRGTESTSETNGALGIVHNIGRRKNQQDTLGTKQTGIGFLAVVSDGMGGLSDGEKVSQKTVMEMLLGADTQSLKAGENPLFEMLSETNEQVLEMLGPEQIYKSGATLLAVLINGSQFHWAAVGDSRIYLYCSRHLLQINREHIYKQQLIEEAVNKKISFSRVMNDPQRDRLLSFLGMGDLKLVDGSLRPVQLEKGDKLLLMSDGIFNTISEQEILWILENTPNAKQAAALMEQKVLEAQNPRQDNFTCIIIDV